MLEERVLEDVGFPITTRTVHTGRASRKTYLEVKGWRIEAMSVIRYLVQPASGKPASQLGRLLLQRTNNTLSIFRIIVPGTSMAPFNFHMQMQNPKKSVPSLHTYKADDPFSLPAQ